MAFPPPFPNPMFSRLPPHAHPPPVPYLGQKFGFFSPQTHPPPPMTMAAIPILSRPPVMNMHMIRKEPPKIPVPVTTVFIGNITDKCHDSVVQEILKRCGSVCNWKRLQDSNGKFKAFGFCDFMHPEGASRALRILRDYPLGDKKLNVKVDDETEKLLEEFTENKAKLLGGEVLDEETDDSVREGIKKIIEEQAPEILELTVEEAPSTENVNGKTAEKSTSKKEVSKAKSPSKRGDRKRSRSSSSSRRRKRSSSRSRKRSPESKKSRKRVSSSESSSAASTSTTEKSKSKSKTSKHGKSSSRRRSPSSEDTEEEADKRRLKRELKEREEKYMARLRKWEEREKRMAKQYAKDGESEAHRQKTIHKEAKKLRQFLEDYQDERDDAKYYKGTALFERRRNYEREREADAKDRQEERREMEEVKKLIMKDMKVDGEVENGVELEETNEDEIATKEADEGTWATVTEQQGSISIDGDYAEQHQLPIIKTEESATESPSPMKKTIVTTLQQKTIAPAAPTMNGVFQDEEEEEDTLHQIKKKIKPFEISNEERVLSLTPEERKRLIKDLIARIPTDREKLFAFNLNWEFVDDSLMESRVRPWINKKICEYIGEEEQSLVAFICEKIAAKCEPENILKDLQMVLDEEADVFMVKLWRLIVYESEAKRLGLSVGQSAQASTSDSKSK